MNNNQNNKGNQKKKNYFLKCTIGICCMDIKGKGKPMQNLIQRLEKMEEIEIIYFGEKTILEKDIEEWPECDVLIAFYSNGFPLSKAIAYSELHPTTWCINNLKWQKTLLDRRLIHSVLEKNNILTARHLVISRDGLEVEPIFIEYPDSIEINGQILEKPFVEKPINAEDHNIYIYYSKKEGGGSVRLFRKIEKKSSERYPNINNVRTNGSYVYEEFLRTDNAHDIKVYTVGMGYAHAESRKSPYVDGKVLRDSNGKEIRYKVDLTPEEIDIANKIILAFKQRVCGFDLLRAGGKSYVCDVNGWSFVKGNIQYYDDCSRILKQMFLDAKVCRGLPLLKPIPNVKELRGIIAVFRHADRTPKQKLKMRTTNKDFLSFFESPDKEVKLKNDQPQNQEKLNKLLYFAQKIVNDPEQKYEGFDISEKDKLIQLIFVLQKGFGGTKIQLKPTRRNIVNEIEVVEQALFICKWGGILTHAGKGQARLLGHEFYERELPQDINEKEKFLQSVLIVSNNERSTAEEFAKGFLGKMTIPKNFIKDNKESAILLGEISKGKGLMNKMKQELHKIMHMESPVDPTLHGIKSIPNPLKTMKELYCLMGNLYENIQNIEQLCEQENITMMQKRWHRLRHNFYNQKKDEFDTTKLPDIFDYITYDIIHNQKALEKLDLYHLFEKSEKMARFIVPEEYGIKPHDKLRIGSLICEPLIRKIYEDIIEISQGDKTKTRLYFSSESHLHSLRNVLLYSNSELTRFHQIIEPVELNYLTHLVFKLYENIHLSHDHPNRFQIEVLFSSGSHNNPFAISNEQHIQVIDPRISINDNLTIEALRDILHIVTAVKDEFSLNFQSGRVSLELNKTNL